jgi:hypothetical protein
MRGSGQRLVACPLAVLALTFLAGCGQSNGTFSAQESPTTFTGSVHGGKQPISAAVIQLFAVGTAGDGSAASPLLSPTTTTDANGTFSLKGLYSCPTSNPLVYLLASGGNPGLAAGSNNTAIKLIAALGKCKTLSSSTVISINEITTVAAVAALAPYMTSASAIGSSSSDASGLSADFTLAAEYANTTTGTTPGSSIPAGESVPTQQIATLADMISSCINSLGGTAGDGGSACGNLFSYSTPTGSSSPTDVVGALLDIFSNPTNNIENLLGLVVSNAPYQPTLTAPPPNLSVALTTTNPALTASSTSVSFAAAQSQVGASTQTFILTNTGSSTITISGVSMTGPNPGDFSVSSIYPATLLAGETCPITVMFLPTATGPRYGDVGITSSASISPIYVALSGSTTTSTTAQVSFTSAALTGMPSRGHFAGTNMQLFSSGVMYIDTRMQTLAATMDLGWVRFPAGTADDDYNWTTGETPNSMLSQFYNNAPGSDYNTMVTDQEIVGGKQDGISLTDFATFLGTQSTGTSETHAIGVINTFTDSASSAATLVSTSANDGITTDVWELGNEPSYFTPSNGSNFYANANAYLSDVSSYASMIKSTMPSAKVAVWVPPNATYAWTTDTAKYSSPFWDELYTHSYPGASGSLPSNIPDTADNEIAFYNGFLLNNTNSLVDAQLAPLFGGNSMLIEFSEYNMGVNLLNPGLYNADFIAEYAMRFSSDSHVTNVGMHMLVGVTGQAQLAITTVNDDSSTLEAEYLQNKAPLNTTSYNFKYFVTVPGLALQIINGVINTSSGVLPTTVGNSATATYYDSNFNAQTMPAIYAQAYSTTQGTYHVLLTNKSSESQSVSIVQDGTQVTQALTTRSIGAPNATTSQYASEQNTSSAQNTVTLTPGTASGTVTVPAYAVMDVSWTP